MSLSLSLGISLSAHFGGDEDMALIDGYFGDGSDGDVTVSGSLTLARDMNYRNLTIAAGAAIDPAGYRIAVSATLDLTSAPSGAIAANGSQGGDAVATAAGAVAATPVVTQSHQFVGISTPVVGKAGGTTTGTAGTAIGAATSHYLGGPPGTTGGTGGTGSSGAGGSAGAFTAGPSVLQRRPAISPGGAIWPIGGASAPSGGSGGGDGTAGGGSGGGGGGGGSVGIFARTILRSSSNGNAGIIQAKGGRGGNGGVPAGGNRGGGGGSLGAGGGYVYIVTLGLTGSAHTNAIDVSGGAGGNGGAKTGTGTDGLGGQAGFGGKVEVITLSPFAVTVYDGTAVGGNANTTITGGTSTAARTDL